MLVRANVHQITTEILSCVGGGPMERLAQHMTNVATTAVRAGLAPASWRRWMSRGAAGRLQARLHASLVFPTQVLLRATRAPTTRLIPTTNPFFLPYLLTLTRGIHGQPVVPLVYDLYPDAIEAAETGHVLRLLNRPLSAMNRMWLRRADGVVFIGQRMADHIMQRYGQPQRWAVIPTGADRTELDGVPGAPSLSPRVDAFAQWVKDRVLIAYVGNWGRLHDLDTFTRALPRFLKRTPHARLLVAASGPGAETLRQHLSEFSSEQVYFSPPLDDDTWRWVMRRTDVSLVSLARGAALTAVPSKTYSALAAGTAVVAVCPSNSDLADLLQEGPCGIVIPPGDDERLSEALTRLVNSAEQRARLREAGQQIAQRDDMPRLAERWHEFLDSIAPSAPIATGPWARGGKRLFDILTASGMLWAVSPLVIAAAIGLWLESFQNPFFLQQRTGRYGRPFWVVKLRTMRSTHNHDPNEIISLGHPDVTTLGKWLRRLKIDELPQLWNILRGDMSFVGPRPTVPEQTEAYDTFARRRLLARPGLTGLAQLHGNASIPWPERFRYDVHYTEHYCALLDLRILLRTPWVVLKGERRFAQPFAQSAYARLEN